MIEEIKTIKTFDGYDLKTVVTMVKQNSKCPALLLIHGAMPSDADCTVPGYYEDQQITSTGNETKSFKDIAEYLSDYDTITVRNAKRGVNYSFIDVDYNIYRTTSFENIVKDTQTVLDYLLTFNEVDRDNVFIAAWSEGTLVAPIIAKTNKIKGVILMAGIYTNTKDTLKRKLGDIAFKEKVDKIYNTPDYEMMGIDRPAIRYKQIFKLKPNYETIMESKTDYLILHGRDDMEIPYTEAKLLEEEFIKANFKNYKIIIYPNLGHAFTPNIVKNGRKTRSFGPFDVEVIKDIKNWIKSICIN